ncbi:MAG TPA: TraR/DksA C4-type zinc finger protein [Candidatus Hydrogenedentes bacterium]|nr:TraR/DksA C4-type zinc finger protein [Candidatus Hydrogenedentota bacterium]
MKKKVVKKNVRTAKKKDVKKMAQKAVTKKSTAKAVKRKAVAVKKPVAKPAVKPAPKPSKAAPPKAVEKPAAKEAVKSESSMTKPELKKFEKLLLDERNRLTGSIRTIEEASRMEAGRDKDGDLASYAETGTDNFELETALNIASGESEWLRNIDEALQRIETGSYGICERCEQPIVKKRLEVFPSARYCIKCQSEYEKEHRNEAQLM